MHGSVTQIYRCPMSHNLFCFLTDLDTLGYPIFPYYLKKRVKCMQVAGSTLVNTKQDTVYAAKKNAVSADGTVFAGKTDSQQANETYNPSKEGLSMLASENLAKYREAEMALENLNKQDGKDPYEDYTRAMKIALNMMRGKRVPPQDEKFLMQFDDELYQAAKNVQMMKELKEDAESELDDEEDDTVEKLRKLAMDGPGAEQLSGSSAGTTAAAPSEAVAAEAAPADAGSFSAAI